LSWPLAIWHSFRARRRLRAHTRPTAESGRLTLKRVA
jgi:hypothetical protein